ncbi:MAG: type IV pilin N-terminal domain-containing protein [Thermoplasmata archaeon]|nr:type IV pilin N-terminal domain-containing protein [Thermoplasmata archaeon]
MKQFDLIQFARSITPSGRSDIRAVSEAIGTVLMLGISVTLAGGIAIWTQQIDDSNYGLYVDLWASVQGDDLVITHRGGDNLGGFDTSIKLSDSSGGLIEGSYSDMKLLEAPPVTDVDWSSGETVTIDIASLDPSFEVLVISSKLNGNPMVLMKTDLIRDTLAGSQPDLAITLLGILNSDSNPVTILNDEGTYLIRIHVTNFGSPEINTHFTPKPDNTFTNLVLFDDVDGLAFDSNQMLHFDPAYTAVPQSDPNFGIMGTGDHLEFTFSWNRPAEDARALGEHTLTAKVVPIQTGEERYQNNFVSRYYQVD